ncbi:TetR/AcrR family transcriptional regulator [Actinomycetospora sp. TBRC 11914]|uniref:TetR/AcrR family transcriptional regulator n=1 Tax=Actinomycetospora sp. TBRC 11914 TaxID=2729387 RepID=UPI00145EC4F9|nr:TetR/AcrR family transcriptional regulator [Actinomycetospora sp. TBRC 11914]NMO90906.1 TetR/AcrR family transcriptional regulator [Actinomycetospora sp. TBRC 11914]
MAERADARQNRARILEVATQALARDGDASLNSVAKLAGVGAGTLYRHFPNREALVLAVYRTEVQRLVDRVPELLAAEPPLAALRTWFALLAGYIRLKRGLGEALTAPNHEAATAQTYGPVIGAIRTLLEAGQTDGTIRPGLDPDDVLLLMGAVWRTPDDDAGREQAERLLDLVVESLRPVTS